MFRWSASKTTRFDGFIVILKYLRAPFERPIPMYCFTMQVRLFKQLHEAILELYFVYYHAASAFVTLDITPMILFVVPDVFSIFMQRSVSLDEPVGSPLLIEPAATPFMKK